MDAPQVRFVVMPEADDEAWQAAACKVVEAAYLDGKRVLVRCGSADQARSLDDLLWRFSDSSFVPHEVAAPGTAVGSPVLLWQDLEPPAAADVLVNLAADVPAWYRQFAQIEEIVDGDEARRCAGRERFRFYRAAGIEPQTHDTGGHP